MNGPEQRALLWDQFFGKDLEGAQAAAGNFRIPEGLTRRTLLLYREIAVRAIKAGKDKQGVQAARLALIDRALQIVK